MGPVVKSLAPWYTGDTSHTYLPVFTPAFQLLSLFPAAVGYWVWVVFNTAALFLYLRFFATQLMLMVVRCLPYFMNIVLGQMDVWVTIFIGEFMRAMLDHKPFRAGSDPADLSSSRKPWSSLDLCRWYSGPCECYPSWRHPLPLSH